MHSWRDNHTQHFCAVKTPAAAAKPCGVFSSAACTLFVFSTVQTSSRGSCCGRNQTLTICSWRPLHAAAASWPATQTHHLTTTTTHFPTHAVQNTRPRISLWYLQRRTTLPNRTMTRTLRLRGWGGERRAFLAVLHHNYCTTAPHRDLTSASLFQVRHQQAKGSHYGGFEADWPLRK